MVATSAIAVIFALIGVVTTVLLLGLAVLGVVELERLRGALRDATGRNRAAGPDGSDPVETLRARYARGEIDDEEFERKLDRVMDAGDAAGGSRDRNRDGERERDPTFELE